MKLLKRIIAMSLCLLMFASDPFSVLAQNDGAVSTVSGNNAQVCVECGGTEAHAAGCSYNPSVTAEATYPNKTFTDSNATYTVEEAMEDGSIKDGDKFNVKLAWSFLDTDVVSTTDEFIYTLPKGFVLYDSEFSTTTFSADIRALNSDTVTGRYDVSYDSTTGISTVKIKFNSTYVGGTGRTGGLNLGGIFDTDLANNGDNEIVVPGHPNPYPIYTPPATPETYDVDIEKSGVVRRESNDDLYTDADGYFYIDYTVEVHAQDGNLTNVVVKDDPDDSLTIDTTTVKGGKTTDSWDQESLITIDNGNGTYSWQIGNLSKGEYYYIQYTAKGNDKSYYRFYNTAEVTTAEGARDSIYDHTVDLKTPTVKKSGTVNDNIVTWEITVDFNDYDYARVSEYTGTGYSGYNHMDETDQNPTVTITYPNGTSSTCSYSDLIGDPGYEVESKNCSYVVLTFDMIISAKYASENSTIENRAYATAGGKTNSISTPVSVTKQEHIVSKTATDLATAETDDAGGGPARIEWKVELNFEAKPSDLYTDPTFADVLVNTYAESEYAPSLVNLRYLPDTFRLEYEGKTYYYNDGKCNGYVSNWETGNVQTDDWINMAGWASSVNRSYMQYQDGYGGGGSRMFQITFSDDAPAGKYTLIYETSYEPDKYPTEDYGNPVYGNSNKLAANVSNIFLSKIYEFDEADADIVINYIRKVFDENKSDKETVVWKIEIVPEYMYVNDKYLNQMYYLGNRDNNASGITITDTLPEDFTIENVYIKNGSQSEELFLQNTSYDANQYRYYTLDDNKLVVYINNGGDSYRLFGYAGVIPSGTYLEVVTTYDDYDSLIPGVESQDFVNKAQLKVNGITYPVVRDKATITPPALISKTLKYVAEEAPRATYTITVNPEAVDMKADSDEITIVDTIEGPQSIIPGTLTVNGATYNNYSLNDDATILTIKGLVDETKYTITYQTRVNKSYDSTDYFTIKNTAVLKGVCRDLDGDGTVEDTEEIFATSSKWTKVVKPSGYTENTNIRPVVTVTKMENSDENKFLEGAVFTVYDPDKNVVGTLTSGEDGVTNEFIVSEDNVVYTMKETTAPEGYILDDETEYKFGRFTTGTSVPEGVENLFGVGFKSYIVKNTAGVVTPTTTSLTITKSGGTAGESFIMNVTKIAEDTTGNTTMQVAVPANGSVTIDGLAVGATYTVTEDANWAWRYADSVKYGNNAEADKITLAADAAANQVTVTNTQDVFKWLSGDSYCENRWNAEGTITATKSSQE